MKNKTAFLILIFLAILSINYVSNHMLTVKKVSPIEYDSYFDVFNFKLELKEVPKNLQTKTFALKFKDLNNKNNNYSTICYLFEEEELLKVAKSKNQTDDITFTCFIEADGLSNKTIDMNIIDIIIYGESNIPVVKIGDKNITFKFPLSSLDPNYNHQKISEKKITHRQINNIEELENKNQINYIYSVLVSQILPDNYSFPQPVSIYYHNNSKTPENESPSRHYAICILNKTVNYTDNEILPVNFYCSINNIKNVSNIDKVKFDSSYNINGFPGNNYDPYEINEKIKNCSITDVSQDTNLPPIFTPEQILGDKCQKLGIIKIKGKFDNDTEEGSFSSSILPDNSITCYYKKVEKGKETELKCYLNKELNTSIIVFDRKQVVNYFYLNLFIKKKKKKTSFVQNMKINP